MGNQQERFEIGL